jgi:hypothetical protein
LQQLCGTDPRVQEKKLHAMEFTVSNCCYLCVLASTVLQTDSKVERWQCRESKLTLPPTHQRMPTREHIPFIYVISGIYVVKVRLKTSLWVFARPISSRECLWVLSHNSFVKREFAMHKERKMQRKNAQTMGLLTWEEAA